MTNNAYRLAAHIADILDANEGDELSPETLAAIRALEGEVADQADALCRNIAQANRSSLSWRQVAAEASHNADRNEHRMVRLKEILFSLLTAVGADKLYTDLYRINIQKSPPKTRLRDGVTTADFPPDFVRIKEEIDLRKILEQHKLGSLPEDVADKVVVETDNKHLKIQPR